VDAAPRQAEIYRFADQGLPAAAIAEQLGRSVGDVELILSLRQTTRRADDEA
jgi:DNA-binding NarL/FixJ family response regulator